MQVRRISVESHIDGVTSNIQVLVVEGLMNVADELVESISIKFVYAFRDQEGSSKDSMIVLRAEAHEP